LRKLAARIYNRNPALSCYRDSQRQSDILYCFPTLTKYGRVEIRPG
jgi:hypothetical protein